VERENRLGATRSFIGPLPALLTTAAHLRGAALRLRVKGIMGAKKKSHRFDLLADLSLDRPVGASGSKPNCAVSRRLPFAEKAQVVEASDGLSGARAIFDFLAAKRLV